MFQRNPVVAMRDHYLDDLVRQTVLADAAAAIHRDAGARVASLVRQRLGPPTSGHRLALRWRLGSAAVLAVMGLTGAVVVAALLPTKPIKILGPLPPPVTTPSLAHNQFPSAHISLAKAQALVPFEILTLTGYPNASLQNVVYSPPARLADGQVEPGARAGFSLFYQAGSLQIQLAESLNPHNTLTLNQKPLPPGTAKLQQVETVDGSQYLVSREALGAGVTGMAWQTAQNVDVFMWWDTPSAKGLTSTAAPMSMANAMNLVRSVS
ncbi:MAG: hypothetical protein ACYDC5_02890 [Candidatus Dormibacteria bacterium]